MPPRLLDGAEIETALADMHPDWTGDPTLLRRSVEFADFTTAVEFVHRLAPRCEELDHHPDLAIRWRWVDVRLATHSAGGVTEKDLELARIVDEVVTELPLADG